MQVTTSKRPAWAHRQSCAWDTESEEKEARYTDRVQPANPRSSQVLRALSCGSMGHDVQMFEQGTSFNIISVDQHCFELMVAQSLFHGSKATGELLRVSVATHPIANLQTPSTAGKIRRSGTEVLEKYFILLLDAVQ